jgi:hypothetical protein
MKHSEFLKLLGFSKRQCCRPTEFLNHNPSFPHVKKDHNSFEVVFNEELLIWLWKNATNEREEIEVDTREYWDIQKLKLEVLEKEHKRAIYTNQMVESELLKNDLTKAITVVRTKFLNLYYQRPNVLVDKTMGEIGVILNDKARQCLEGLTKFYLDQDLEIVIEKHLKEDE